MKFSNVISIDRIWGDKISANRYLLPLSILLSALAGVLSGGSSMIDQLFSTNVVINLPAMCGSLILIWAYNLAESIIAASVWWVAVCRSLLSLVAIVAAFALGYVAAVIVIVILAAILVLWILTYVLMYSDKNGSSVSGGDSSESSTDDEYEVKGEDGSIRTIVEDRPGYGHFKDTGETLHQDGDRWIKD